MKTQKFYNIFIFAIAILLVIIIGVILGLNLLSNRQSPNTQISPTPFAIQTREYSFPTLNPLPTLKATTIDISSLVKKMPVVTNNYNIEYLTTSNSFILTVKKSPYEANLALAKTWFQKEGVNINNVNVLFYKYRFVQ